MSKMLGFLESLTVEEEDKMETQIKIMADKIRKEFGTVIPAVKTPSVYISIEIPKHLAAREFICFEREQYPEIGWSWSVWVCRNDQEGYRVKKDIIKSVPRAKVILGLFLARADNIILNALKEIKGSNPKLHEEVSNKFYDTVLP